VAGCERSTLPVPEPAGWRFDGARLRLTGTWTVPCLEKTRLENPPPVPPGRPLAIDGSALTALDSAGARAIVDLRARLQRQGGVAVRFEGFTASQRRLLALLEGVPQVTPREPQPRWLERLGPAAFDVVADGLAYLAFVGRLALQGLGWLRHPRRIRWRATLAEMQRAGVNALFIVGLLSFLMGVVIAYQGGDPLSRYGANIYLVDLVGLTMLREIAPW